MLEEIMYIMLSSGRLLAEVMMMNTYFNNIHIAPVSKQIF